MTSQDRLLKITALLIHTDRLISNFENELKHFFALNPYVIGVINDIPANKCTYYVKNIPAISPDIEPNVSDILHNLRSILDHLAFQLVDVGTKGQAADSSYIYFPIKDNASGFRKKAKQDLAGATSKAIDTIVALKPYKSGNDKLWQLHKLANVNKHRYLLGMSNVSSGVDFSRSILRLLHEQLNLAGKEVDLLGSNFAEMKISMPQVGMEWPLKVGDVLFIDHANTVGDVIEPKFGFELSIDEYDIVKAQPVIPMLRGFFDEVNGIVQLMKPFLL